jgi:tripartite-type tricarboxylate transporter receptor subunit TctC
VKLTALAGTPKEIIDLIAAEFASAAKDPAFVALLSKQGVTPAGLSPQAFKKLQLR